MINQFQIEVGGRVLQLEVGRLANLANGAVTVRYGDTLVLVTACASKSAREGIDFLPLTIDFEEKMYAAGKIPGSFFKREGRPSTDATLMARLTDRPLRPLFPKDYHNETQVIATILSADRINPPDIPGMIGASAALAISDIPFDDPIGACRIGLVDGELVVNPTYQELETSALDLTVAGTADAIMMVEAGANIVSERVMIDALRLAQEVNTAIVELIREMQGKVGRQKWPVAADEKSAAAEAAARAHIGSAVAEALARPADKQGRQNALLEIRDRMIEALAAEHDPQLLKAAFDNIETEAVREAILKEGRRPDGRSLEEIRPLKSEIGVLPRAHGTGLFTRGETQILSVATLASQGDHQRLDNLSPISKKYYLHHYNFPPYSTGEVKRMFTGRREIGHGALAERALEPVVPSQDEFPYTIRVVSEALSSNGSTSMASVCGSTLALMDAGVPIKAPVAGIAMGLITGQNGEAAILTDIQGAEDHSGDMDFKVAGTAEGITALQMDIKVKGITFEIMEKALDQARGARMIILDHLASTLAAPREELSQYAPRMLTLKIPVDKIGAVIGPGGKVIRGMIEEFGVTIDVADDGTVIVGSSDRDAAEKAKAQIEALTREVEVGAVYQGKVVRIMTFGAFVEILPGKDGLVHISELADHRVESVEAVVKIGDSLEVVVTEIDRMGRVNLSARAAKELSDGAVGASSRVGLPEARHDDGDERPSRPPFEQRPARRQVGGFRGERRAGPPRRR